MHWVYERRLRRASVGMMAFDDGGDDDDDDDDDNVFSFRGAS